MSETDAEGPGASSVVDAQGRLTIPAQIRWEARIDAGTPLVVYVEDGRVVIETREQLSRRARQEVGESWSGETSVVEELLADRRTAAACEEQR